MSQSTLSCRFGWQRKHRRYRLSLLLLQFLQPGCRTLRGGYSDRAKWKCQDQGDCYLVAFYEVYHRAPFSVREFLNIGAEALEVTC